jgi:uncharacterized Zn finger protein
VGITADHPLTCQHCRNKAVTQVIIADLPRHGRIVHLICADCGDFTMKIHDKRSEDLIWRYALTSLKED